MLTELVLVLRVKSLREASFIVLNAGELASCFPATTQRTALNERELFVFS